MTFHVYYGTINCGVSSSEIVNFLQSVIYEKVYLLKMGPFFCQLGIIANKKRKKKSFTVFWGKFFSYPKGAFNNYVDKKKGRRGQPKVHICPLRSRGPKFEKNPAFIESILYHCALDMIQILLSMKVQGVLKFSHVLCWVK